MDNQKKTLNHIEREQLRIEREAFLKYCIEVEGKLINKNKKLEIFDNPVVDPVEKVLEEKEVEVEEKVVEEEEKVVEEEEEKEVEEVEEKEVEEVEEKVVKEKVVEVKEVEEEEEKVEIKSEN